MNNGRKNVNEMLTLLHDHKSGFHMRSSASQLSNQQALLQVIFTNEIPPRNPENET